MFATLPAGHQHLLHYKDPATGTLRKWQWNNLLAPGSHYTITMVHAMNDHHVATATVIHNPSGQTKQALLLPVDFKVTDHATKNDALPYSAVTNPDSTENSELCLKADKATESATVELEINSITNNSLLSTLRWKVLQKPTDTLVEEGLFGGTTPPTVELSLGSGSNVEDEILFEIQVGVDSSAFSPAVKIAVRVVRDRLNWWFDPFSTDLGWRTARPEPREDTGDYKRTQNYNASGNLEWVPDTSHPDHKPTAYQRESLQSIYDFLKSTDVISANPSGTPTNKTNWLPPSVTCFGEFHELLKVTHSNNPLVDLNSLSELNMTNVISLQISNLDVKYNFLLSALAKQTTMETQNSLGNPNFIAGQFPNRVQWASNAANRINDSRLPTGRLIAIWQKEGSLKLNSQYNTTTNFNPNIVSGTPIFRAPHHPTTVDEAKVCYIVDATYEALGSDFLIPTYRIGGQGDNIPDLHDYAAALAHIRTKVDQYGGAGSADRLLNALTVSGISGNYIIAVNETEFYSELLYLVGQFYLAGWQPEGADMSYMVYNAGSATFNLIKATVGGTIYPERGRLGLVDWAIHYEIRQDEWHQLRRNTARFHAFRKFFESKYP